MTAIRSIHLVCDRCGKETAQISAASKAGIEPVKIRVMVAIAVETGWRCVNAGGNPRGGSRRFHFCPDSICQAAAEEVPQRMSEYRRAEYALQKAKDRMRNVSLKNKANDRRVDRQKAKMRD